MRRGCWSSHLPHLSISQMPNISAARSCPIAAQSAPVRLLVIEANGIIDIDYTGSQTLSRVIINLRAGNIDVAIARLSDGRAQAQARRTGLIDAIGVERVFMSVEEAVQKLGPRAQSRVRV